MAEKAKGFSFKKAVRERRRQAQDTPYNWDAWLDGDTWLLIQGEDFTIPPEQMRQRIYKAARDRSVKVTTHITDDGDIYLRKVPTPRASRRTYQQVLEDLGLDTSTREEH